MRYITLAAGHWEPTLQDALHDDLRLSAPLELEMRAWNHEYASELLRRQPPEPTRSVLVERLDDEGLRLAVRIASEVGAKVTYYSSAEARRVAEVRPDGPTPHGR